MDNLIDDLKAVRTALGTLSIISSRRNMDILLSSMNILDIVVSSLQHHTFAGQSEAKEESEREWQNQQ